MRHYGFCFARLVWPAIVTLVATCEFGGEAPASVVDPATVPGLALRLDASAITGLTNGQAVSTWLDTSGNGQNATGGVSPIYATNQMNNKPVVRFNGTSQFLTDPAFVSGAQTWFIVYHETVPVPASDFQSLMTLFDGSGRYSDVLLMNLAGYQNVSLTMDFPAFSAASVGINPSLDTANHVLALTYNGSGTATPNYQIGFDAAAQTVLGSGPFGEPSTGGIGARGAGVAYFNGDIAEILVYTNVLSSTDYAGIQDYLFDKWLVPEPSTLLLFGGGGLLAFRLRRRFGSQEPE